MALTPRARERAYSMFDEGKTTSQVARSLRITPGSAAALKANHTRNSAPKNFLVTGSILVEATSREEAMATFSPRRSRGVKVLDVTVDSCTRQSLSSASS